MQYTYVKYKNRKIYCVNESCYVSLGDIGSDVLTGIEPRIVCHATKRDITAEVLSDVVALRRRSRATPVETLLAELRQTA